VKQRLDRVARTRVVEYYAATEGSAPLSTRTPGSPVPARWASPGRRGVIVADEDGVRSCRRRGPRVPARRGGGTLRLLRRRGEDVRRLPGQSVTLGDVVTSTRTATVPDRPLIEPDHLWRCEHLPGRGRRVLLEHESVADWRSSGCPTTSGARRSRRSSSCERRKPSAQLADELLACAGSASRTTSVRGRLFCRIAPSGGYGKIYKRACSGIATAAGSKRLSARAHRTKGAAWPASVRDGLSLSPGRTRHRRGMPSSSPGRARKWW